MIIINDTILVHASPARIAAWLAHIPDNYLDWHPKDHVRLDVVRWGESHATRAIGEGAILRAYERVGPRVLRMRFKVLYTAANSMTWKALGLLGVVGRVRGSFRIEQTRMGSLFHAQLAYGWRVPLLGTLIDKFVNRFVVSTQDVERHVKEEGVFLKKAVEE